MAMTLAELRRLNAGGQQVELGGLSIDERASIKAELQAEQDARVRAEAATSRKQEAAAKRRSLRDPGAAPGAPRDVATGRMISPGSVEEIPDPAARSAGLRAEDTRTQAARPVGTRPVTSAEQIQSNVREQIRSPIPGEPVRGRETMPRAPTASEAIDPGIRRSPADEAAAERVRAQQTRVASGATEANIERIQAEQTAAKRAAATAEATGAQPRRPLSRETPILDPGGDIYEPARPGRELDPEGRAAVGKIDEGIATNTDRQNRAADTIRRNEAAGTPDSREAKAARAVIKTTEANLADLEGQRIDANLAERKAGNRPVSATVEQIKAKAGDPLGTADDAVKKAGAAFDAAVDKADVDSKEDIKKVKKMFNSAVEKTKAGAKTLKGRISPSASASASVEDVAKNMPDGPKKAGAVKSFGTIAKVGGVAGLVDMAGLYLRNGYENGWDVANVDVVEGVANMVRDSKQMYDDVRGDEIGMDEAVKTVAQGFIDGVVGLVPSLIDTGQFFAGEALDALGPASTATAPTGLRGTGVSAPASPEFTGPADPGELPGRPGERYDPLSETADLELRSGDVQTDPFLTPGAREGQFNVGLRGGTGVIDATNAPGGASGFAQRVEESRRAGAYDPVSDKRRDEALEDLQRVKRGTTAIRDLAATRLGVPTQYLDAVRSGAMTPREANLAQAKQAATGNLGGMSAAEGQQYQHRAAAEQRAVTEFQGKLTDQGRARVAETGLEVANSFPGADEERKAEIASGYSAFASNWIPEGVDPSSLTAGDHQTIKGQYILATELADKGEGWLRSLMPWKADITAPSLFGRGENILQSMEQAGEWFDIGNDNLEFRGRDSDNQPVTLTIEPEKLHPIAQGLINEARAEMNIRQGLR